MIYCTDKNLDYNVVKFLYDGRHINISMTPNEVCTNY
ncbi:hypothetical protein ACJIZ3_008602 [Penstemon smallii]|uniref:Uncharacterized protein n=1 Tax=Penstemon smallii TaxID=265156 RepID=A0ABD3TB73_9LAMI